MSAGVLAVETTTARRQWIAALVLLYVAVSVIGWHRTLIDDENWHLLQAARPFGEQLESYRLDMVHPPLMYLLSSGWMALVGHTDNAVKWLILILGSASIITFSAFAPRVVARWKLAAFLFCAAYLQLGGVPNLLRGYSVGLLLTVLALFAWERWRSSASNHFLALWAAAMVLLVYTHVVGLLLLPAFVLLNWWYGQRRGLFLAVSVCIGLSFLPWAAYVFPVYAARGTDMNVGHLDENVWRVASKLPFHALTYLPSGWNVLGMNDWPRETVARQAMVLAALAVHAGLLFLARHRLRELWPPSGARAAATPWLWASVILVAVPVVVLFVVSLSVAPLLSARFVAFVLPMYWIGVVTIADYGGRAGRVILNMVVVPWVLVSVAVPLTRALQQDSLHQSIASVNRVLQPADMVLTDGLIGRQVYWEWTRSFQRRDSIKIISSSRSLLDTPDMPLQPLEEVDLSAVRRIWFFATALNGEEVEAIRHALGQMGYRVQPNPSGQEQPFLTLFELGR